MLIFVKPLAKGHSCCKSLDPMPSMLQPAEGCVPESYSLQQLPSRSLLRTCDRCPVKHGGLQDVLRKITAWNLSHIYLLKCSRVCVWLQHFKHSRAPALQLHLASTEPEHRSSARHEPALAGQSWAALGCVTRAWKTKQGNSGAALESNSPDHAQAQWWPWNWRQ